MSSAQSTAPDRATADPWLFGPVRDLLLGCGLGYAAVLVVVLFIGPDLQRWLPAGLLVIVVMFANTPHYGATLLRVYEQREDRRRYAVFSVGISAGLAVAFVVACYWYEVGSWLLTVYLNWSPWHYAGQNYGIALMFLHRRGVPIPIRAKQWLYASFVLAFLLTFVKVNGVVSSVAYGVEGATDSESIAGPIYDYMSIGIRADLQFVLLAVGFVAYATATLGAFRMLLRGGRAIDLAPTALVVASQSLWFVVPALFQTLGIFGETIAFSSAHTQYAFMFIAASHSLQYLWITAYYAKREPNYRTAPRYLVKTMLAGCMIWTLPALLFAPGLLGTVAYNDGLVLLVAAVVNLHHFVLDGAIWKLRDGRVARVLLRSARSDSSSEKIAPGRVWLAAMVWTVGLACFVVAFTARWDAEFGVRRAANRGDLEGTRGAVTRLAFLGRDHAFNRRRLARVAAQNNHDEFALEQLHRSLALKPDSRTWLEIGHIHAKREHWQETVDAYEAAYALAPTNRLIIGRLGWALIYNDDPVRANQVLREGLRAHPNDPQILRVLEQAQALQYGAESSPTAD